MNKREKGKGKYVYAAFVIPLALCRDIVLVHLTKFWSGEQRRYQGYLGVARG